MGWDASRAVPWRRLLREWLIYVVIMAGLFLLFFRDESLVGIMAGLLVSGPLYLVFGYVLAKFGYQRKTLRQARDAATPAKATGSRDGGAVAPPRPRPAPTRRTGGDGGRPTGKRRR